MYRSILLAAIVVANIFGQQWSQVKSPASALFKESQPFTLQPEARETGAGERYLVSVSAESITAYQTAPDGTQFTFVRLAMTAASANAVHLKSVHLPDGARLYVFGLDSDGRVTQVHGPYTGTGPLNSGEFMTPGISADEIVLELQGDPGSMPDLPFEIASVQSSEAVAAAANVSESSSVRSESASAPDSRTGLFRGRIVKYAVIDGLAVMEGDMILGRADDIAPISMLSDKSRVRSSVAITGAMYRWPNGVVPFVIDPALPNPSRVTEAVQHWNTKLTGTISIVPRTNETNYLVFAPASSMCASGVGMSGGAQRVSLGEYCEASSTIHEIGHAVGLWHEQSRHDRDQHIRVLYENIDPDKAYNFDRVSWDGEDVGAYDYASRMHYAAWAFSNNGLPTIETIPPGIPIGQFSGLSAGDIAGVRAIYGSTPPSPVPATVSITLTSNPPGRTLVVDGTNVITPASFTWTSGSQHVVSALSFSEESGTRYVFQSWTIGGGQTQAITVPSSNTTYTASFAVQHRLAIVVNPAGAGTVSVSPASPDGYYAANSVVSVSAASNSGSTFTSWSGLIAGTPATTQVTMSKPYSIAANFAVTPPPPAPVVVVVSSNPAGRTVKVDGVDVVTPASLSWTSGSQHVLSAASSEQNGTRYVFQSWSNSGAQTQTITAPTTNATYTATFSVQYRLSTSVTPAGSGSVGISPASPDGYYPANSTVTLSAVATSGFSFTAWSGLPSGTQANTQLLVSKPYTITAGFAAQPPLPSVVTVVVTSNSAGREVIVDGTSVVTPASFSWATGSTHVLSAPSSVEQNGSRYVFASWNIGTAQTQTVTVQAAATYTASFRTLHRVTAAVSPSIAGTVLISPASADGYYPENTTVSISAQANSGYVFSSWTGSITGTAAMTQVQMTRPHNVTANMMSTVSGVSAINPTVQAVPGSGGTYSVRVTAPAGTPWVVSTSAAWIRLAAATGNGSSTFTYTVERNNGNSGRFSRTGTISVGGRTLTVTQDGRRN